MFNNSVIKMWGALTFALFLCWHDVAAQIYEDRTVDIYHGNFTNDVRRLLVTYDSYGRALVQYVTEKNIPMSDVVDILEWFIEEGLKIPHGDPNPCLDRAIGAMGKLKLNQCIPYLTNLANQPDFKSRATLINSITQIGGSNAVSFGVSVISETNIYSLDDRLLFYDYTARSVTSGSFDKDVIRTQTAEERIMALGFLVAEPRADEKLDRVLYMDDYNARLMPNYRTHEVRLAFLTYFCTNAPLKYRSKFIERVKSLRPDIVIDVTTNLSKEASVTQSVVAVVNAPVSASVMTSNQPASVSALPIEKPRRSYVLWLAGFFGLCIAGVVALRIKRK